MWLSRGNSRDKPTTPSPLKPLLETPLLETPERLTSTADPGPNTGPCAFGQLQQGFQVHPFHAGDDLCGWALHNADSAILNLVNDQSFAAAIQRIPQRITRRWNTFLRHHRTSLANLAVLSAPASSCSAHAQHRPWIFPKDILPEA
ncbi:hypothetical protein ColLi_13256 [Colletotrichum liriopes]|uniref:Uncharacterized protein n=1 Tax=Colletotrichum liriopes TaxID=708192 RepID=A0AA37M0G4_9PEZI|nr:hypothetical protein ColLi_13256 [Colletotrichum liriopes]